MHSSIRSVLHVAKAGGVATIDVRHKLLTKLVQGDHENSIPAILVWMKDEKWVEEEEAATPQFQSWLKRAGVSVGCDEEATNNKFWTDATCHRVDTA